VIEELGERLKEGASESGALKKETQALERAIRGKDGEREAILRLYRRQRIDDATLDQQLDQIEKERTGLSEAHQNIQGRILAAEESETQVHSAEALLKRLHERLDEPLTWDVKRELVETLVEGIRVDTLIEGTNREAVVTVNYRFGAPEAHSSLVTSIGMGSLPPPDNRDPGQPDSAQAEGTE
jgi:signal recognition particle GTPase